MNQGYTTIYTLSHPVTNQVFYVGRTKHSVAHRTGEHSRDARKYDYGICSYIRDIHSLGLKPIGEVLDTCSHEEGVDYETYWINQLKEWGLPILNQIEGGKGKKGWVCTEEAKEKRKATKTKNGTWGKGGRPKGHLSQSIEVIHLPTGKKYPSLKHAARETGMKYTTLRNRLVGNGGGHLNEYAFLGERKPQCSPRKS